MPFTTPLALLGLLFVPAVIAMYLLKLRRDERVVPSTLLWTALISDVEANAPWQKLRRSLLLLLQLLLVLILALLAARPFLERPAGLARDIVLVLDTSASMAATDVVPSRLEAAKTAALDALRDLPAGGKVSIVTADRTARIVVNETADMGRVRQALDGIEPTSASGDFGDALELAGKLAARSGDAQILVATDGAWPDADRCRGCAGRVLSVGRWKERGVVALAVRTAPSADPPRSSASPTWPRTGATPPRYGVTAVCARSRHLPRPAGTVGRRERQPADIDLELRLVGPTRQSPLLPRRHGRSCLAVVPPDRRD
jgi:hypothetical protein